MEEKRPRYRVLKESAELMPGAIIVKSPWGSYYNVESDSMHLMKGFHHDAFFYARNVVEEQPSWFERIEDED